jgi:lipopolysaccharide/colanic/teichoic acid biosynthesis glycosyltransferase
MWFGRVIDQRLPRFLAVCAATAAVIAVLVVVEPLWEQIALLIGLLATSMAGDAYRRKQQVESLIEFTPCHKAALTADEFGAKHSDIAEHLFPGREPPYIAREREDTHLDEALHTARFVVVTGVTNAGKSRAVFEAIGRVHERAKIVVPNSPSEDGDPLVAFLTTKWLVSRRRYYVVVINDLERRLNGLPPFAIRDWLKAHPRCYVIAMLSAESWADRVAEEDRLFSDKVVKLLHHTITVEIHDEFEGQSLLEARDKYQLPEGQTRLGAHLASAEQTIFAFRAAGGRCACARPLALSAINCVRAGLGRPIRLSVLIELASRITAHSGWIIDDTEWQAGIDYCTGGGPPTAAILRRPSSADSATSEFVYANPVLVEVADLERPSDVESTRLPAHIWDAIIEIVADGSDDLLAIAASAYLRGRPDLGRELLKRISREGSGSAQENARLLLAEPNRADERQDVTDYLDRAHIGSDIRVWNPSIVSIPPTKLPSSPTGGIFDSTYDRSYRAIAFYHRFALRDTLRFLLLLALDTSAVGAGIFAARELRAVGLNRGATFGSSIAVVGIATALVLVFFLLSGLYRADSERARLREILTGTGLAAVTLAFIAIGSNYSLINVPVVLAAAAGASVLVFLLRTIYDRLSRAWVRALRLESRVLIVASERPTAMADLVLRSSPRPMQMVGYLSTTPSLSEPGRLGTSDELTSVAFAYQIDRVIIATPDLGAEERLAVIYRCHVLGLSTDLVPTAPQLFQGMTDALDDPLAPFVAVPPLYFGYIARIAKRVMDCALAIPLCFVAMIVLGPSMIAIKLQSPKEPILVPDWRPGLSAVPFPMWRLRTTRNGVATRLGQAIGRFRIDELPQFINVFVGTMSLVGPRPLTNEEFETLDSFQRLRYAVLPGITGLWQIARRKETSLEEMTKLDIVYCRNWTPLLDLTILLRTLVAVAVAPAEPWVASNPNV